jgi:AraC family transcriptional regulator
MVAVYHDDPETTPPDALRSDAAVSVPKQAEMPKGLTEVRLPAGRYACATHIGPYTGLGDAWARFMGEWLPASGNRAGQGLGYEIYRNNPTNTAPGALRTELYLPLA